MAETPSPQTPSPEPPSSKTSLLEMPSPETAKFVVETIQWLIDAQDGRFDSIRTKATVVLASSGLIFSRLIELRPDPEHLSRGWWLWVAAFAVAAAFLLALWAVLPHWLRRDPKPRAFIEFYLLQEPVAVHEQLAVTLRDTYEVNEKSIRSLARTLRLSVGCLGLAVLAFMATAGVEWGAPWDQRSRPPAAQPIGPKGASKTSPSVDLEGQPGVADSAVDGGRKSK